MKINSWHEYFMRLALTSAAKSKDPSSQVGAVITRDDNRIISIGYNGFPQGVFDPSDNEDLLIIQTRAERPEKYFWNEHAERNAVYNAARIGVSTLGGIMYTNGIPCCDCARGIIQCGIIRVYTLLSWDNNDTLKWKEMAERSKTMFYEANVELIQFDMHFGIELMRHEQLVEL